MKNGASLTFHRISLYADVTSAPFIGCSFPAISISFPSLSLAHTYTPTQVIGFQLATSSPDSTDKKKKKKKIRKISVKAKLEMSKVEYVYSYLDALNKKRQRMNLML